MYFDCFLFQDRGVWETQTKAYAIKGKHCSIYTCVSIFIVNVKFHEILHVNFEQRWKNIKQETEYFCTLYSWLFSKLKTKNMTQLRINTGSK